MISFIINQILLLAIFFICKGYVTDHSTQAILLMLFVGFSVLVTSIENLKNDRRNK